MLQQGLKRWIGTTGSMKVHRGVQDVELEECRAVCHLHVRRSVRLGDVLMRTQIPPRVWIREDAVFKTSVGRKPARHKSAGGQVVSQARLDYARSQSTDARFVSITNSVLRSTVKSSFPSGPIQGSCSGLPLILLQCTVPSIIPVSTISELRHNLGGCPGNFRVDHPSWHDPPRKVSALCPSSGRDPRGIYAW